MTSSYYDRSSASASNMNRRKMSTHLLGLGIGIVGVLILSVALILGLEFPKFARNRLVEDQCVASSDHKSYYKWVSFTWFLLTIRGYF